MTQPYQLDPHLIARHYQQAAPHYPQHAWLAREISQRMRERLDYIQHTPQQVIDLGCGCGEDARWLAERYPQAEVTGVDNCPAMLEHARQHGGWLQRLSRLARRDNPRWLTADAAHTGLPEGSATLVWSNQLLQTQTDPGPILQEMHRLLATGGMLMFSTLGPDTLRELRSAFADDGCTHVHSFIDMHDLGDALIGAGFSDPVVDMEILTVTYDQVADLIADLRAAGGRNAAQMRPRHLMGRQRWQQMLARYDALRRDGKLPATFEIVYGHAWKPAPKPDTHLPDGRAIMQFHRQAPGR